jgi:hypothetical protein
MGDERRRQDERPTEGRGRDEGQGGLLDLLRRVVGPRQPAVLVMDRDGQVRKVEGRR